MPNTVFHHIQCLSEVYFTAAMKQWYTLVTLCRSESTQGNGKTAYAEGLHRDAETGSSAESGAAERQVYSKQDSWG